MFVYAAEVTRTVRDAARYGIGAGIDRVRWHDIVSRIFGRIDPGATSTSTVGTLGSDRSSRTAAICFARPAATSSPPTQVVIAAGSRTWIPPAIVDIGVHYCTSDDVMRIAELPERLVIIGGGFVAAGFAHIFSALGVRVTLVIRGGTLLRHCDDAIGQWFTRMAATKWELRPIAT